MDLYEADDGEWEQSPEFDTDVIWEMTEAEQVAEEITERVQRVRMGGMWFVLWLM